MQFDLKCAKEIDMDRLFRFLEEVYSSSDMFCERFGEKYSETNSIEQEIAAINSSPGGFFFVALAGNEITGFLKLVPCKPKRLAHTAWLTLGVHPNWQQQGVAKFMIRECEDAARKLGPIEIIYLMVREDNHGAIKMSQKAGYEILAKLKNDTKIGDRYYDGYMMAKYLLEQKTSERKTIRQQ